MVTGAAGSVGHDILYYLSVTSGVGKIIAADMAEKECRSQIKEAVVSANFLGYYPDMSFRKLDLFDVDDGRGDQGDRTEGNMSLRHIGFMVDYTSAST